MGKTMIFSVAMTVLAGCQTLRPVPAQSPYRAIGTEPFWDLSFGRELVFTDRGTGVAVTEPTPPRRRGVGRETYQGRRLVVSVIHAPCSDGMSERIYPDTVEITVDARVYRGCGADAAFFAKARP